MKKLSVLLMIMIASVAAAGAQGVSVGVRTVSGLQAVAQFHVTDHSYLEFRGGMSWLGGSWSYDFYDLDDFDHHDVESWGVTADFTALYNWRAANFDWTDEGNWFLDLGAGVNFGGRERYSYVGLAGMGRMGYTFENFPLTLACDWTPVFGPDFTTYRDSTHADFYRRGLANVGFTATWKF